MSKFIPASSCGRFMAWREGVRGELYMSGKCSSLLDIKHLTRKCFNEGESNENIFKLAWMLMTIPHEIHMFD